MKVFTITIDKSITSHEMVLGKCYEMVDHFKNNPDSEIYMDFTGLDFIYPDYSLLILCALKYLESKGIIVHGKIKYTRNSGGLNYLGQMGFFKYLQVDIPYELSRKRPNSYVSIQRYDRDNQIEILESLMGILKANVPIDDDVFASLDYCFNEILDNVLLHSQTGEGWVVGQYFPNMNAIRLIVCDFGLGICETLKKAYNFTEEEALTRCIEEGITSGQGQGHGLFATSKFIELNKGWLSIISGSHKLDYNNKQSIVSPIPFWQGTCVYMRINTNISVDYKQFTGKHYDYKEHLFEKMFENE